MDFQFVILDIFPIISHHALLPFINCVPSCPQLSLFPLEKVSILHIVLIVSLSPYTPTPLGVQVTSVNLLVFFSPLFSHLSWFSYQCWCHLIRYGKMLLPCTALTCPAPTLLGFPRPRKEIMWHQ